MVENVSPDPADPDSVGTEPVRPEHVDLHRSAPDPTDAVLALERELGRRTRTLIASELVGLGLPADLLDDDRSRLVLAAGYAALVDLLRERDHDGHAIWTLAGLPGAPHPIG
jgi:hypothetical protein